jgi:hypothetical protein
MCVYCSPTDPNFSIPTLKLFYLKIYNILEILISFGTKWDNIVNNS